MKPYLVYILLIAACGYTACKKSDTTAPVVVPPVDTIVIYMSANINSTAWNSSSAYGNTITVSANGNSQSNMTIVGKTKVNGIGSEFSILLTNYTGVGTYTIAPPQITATFYNGNQRHYATTGQVNITKDSATYMMGNFSFIADTTHVTNGAFTVRY
ncbi:MAG: hypothetical protein WCG87_10500 [Bacteroidota bacterium]